MNASEAHVYLQVSPQVERSHTLTVLLKVLETLSFSVKVENRAPNDSELTQFSLFLICANDVTWQDMLPAHLMMLARDHNVVIYNASQHTICEQLLLMANVKGAFYDNDTPDVLLKGISKILNNELWFKRASISRAFSSLMEKQPKYQTPVDINGTLEKLTSRERTIIRLISQGAKNKDVAEQLHISDHTVKTHLYSAFKKTNARNRIELVNWAQQYLPSTMTSRSIN